MALVAVVTLIVAIWAYSTVRSEGQTGDNWVVVIFAGAFGALVGILIALFLSLILPYHAVANQPVYLTNLYDHPEINGTFYLGSGHVESKEVLHYSYMVDGFKEYSHLDKESVRTAEDNPEQPYLIIYHNEYNQEWMNLIAFKPDHKNQPLPKPEFHIPKGSVDENYSIK